MKRRIFASFLALVFCALVFCPLSTVFAADDTIVIDCVGDSITWGSGSTNAIDGKRVETKNYVGRLTEMLGDGYTLYNDSKPGASLLQDWAKNSISEGGYASVSEITASFARTDLDIVILMLGTNDSKVTAEEGGVHKMGIWDTHNGGVEKFEAAYRELLQIYFDMESKPFVYVMMPTPTLPQGVNGNVYRITDANLRDDICPLIKSIAEDLKASGLPIDYIDLRSAFPDPDTEEGVAELKTLLADGVHPNQTGYELMAKTVYEKLSASIHTLTYSSEGLDADVSAPKGGTVISGQTVTIKNTRGRLTKNGFANIGWSLTPDGEVLAEGSELKVGDSDITLYAIFPAEANGSDSTVIIIAAVGAVLVIGLVVAGVCILKKQKKAPNAK